MQPPHRAPPSAQHCSLFFQVNVSLPHWKGPLKMIKGARKLLQFLLEMEFYKARRIPHLLFKKRALSAMGIL